MNIETLKRATQLTKELKEITENEELKDKLSLFSMDYHSALSNISEVNISDNSISFLASGYARGYFENEFTVTWDFLDNPNKYIQKKRLEALEKAEKEEEERKKKLEERERQKLKELKEKYESTQLLRM